MNTVIVRDKAVYCDTFSPEKLSPEESLRLGRLVTWKYDALLKCYSIQRRFPHKVGRVIVKNVVYSVIPDMSAQDFTTFFLYSLGVRIDKFSSSQSSEITAAYGNTHQDFRTLAASLLIISAEQIAGSFLAKGYVSRREILYTIRGRIDWQNFIRPGIRVGVPCLYSEISIDNLLNQVVLAGLRAVQDVSISTAFRKRLNEQLFTWSSIASYRHIKLTDLQLAERSLNRLTEKYQSIIGLCRMVMFGYGPDDFFNAGKSDFQCLEFDLALLFERFVLRLIQYRLDGSLLAIESQVRERNGLRNGYGLTYHKTRPDFYVRYKGVPIAVLDAKFKPRYVSLSEAGFTKANKVSEADVYQVLFYAQRATQLAGGVRVPAFIVSPRIDPLSSLPEKQLRRIDWVHDGKTEASIEVLDVDIPATIAAIRSNGEFPDDGLAIACEAFLNQHPLNFTQTPTL